MSDTLPKGWETRQSKEGRTFYKNTVTGKTQWDLPTEPAVAILNPLPPGWSEKKSSAGKTFYYNKNTGESRWERPSRRLPPKRPRVALPFGWQEKVSHSGKVFYYHKATRKTQWERPVADVGGGDAGLGPGCENIRGLKWTGMSCYLDSTLLSLFAQPTAFVDNLLNMDLAANPLFGGGERFLCGDNAQEDLANRQAVQAQLKLIAESIRGTGGEVEYCTDLRATLANCPHPEHFEGSDVAEAGEFLSYILSMFPLNIAQKKTVTYGTDNLVKDPPAEDLTVTSTIWDRRASVVQWVSDFDLLLAKDATVPISSFLQQVLDSGALSSANKFKAFQGDNTRRFDRRIATTTLEYTPYLIFRLSRVSQLQSEVIRTKVIPDPEVNLPNGQRFALSAVVIHTGGAHYVAVFRCNDTWYFYDDSPAGATYTIRKLGGYDAMLAFNRPSPITLGTLYFYTPIGVVPDPPAGD